MISFVDGGQPLWQPLFYLLFAQICPLSCMLRSALGCMFALLSASSFILVPHFHVSMVEGVVDSSPLPFTCSPYHFFRWDHLPAKPGSSECSLHYGHLSPCFHLRQFLPCPASGMAGRLDCDPCPPTGRIYPLFSFLL